MIASPVKSSLGFIKTVEKPSELVLYRHSRLGGLGLFNVKIRALALLVRSFLETACNPKFRHSLLHEILYRYHILGDDSIPDPGYLPYYDRSFFSTIKHYKDNCPLNIEVMTTRQWYRVLLEDRVTMQANIDGDQPTLIPVRAELSGQGQDWLATWAMLKTNGLSSENASFLFKLLHQLLPTQDRINRITKEMEVCKVCKTDSEDLWHAFFGCQPCKETSDLLLSYVSHLVPGISSTDVLSLNFATTVEENDRLPTLVLIATGLRYIWQTRADKKTVCRYKMRTEIEATISILRKTRYSASAERLLEMIT